MFYILLMLLLFVSSIIIHLTFCRLMPLGQLHLKAYWQIALTLLMIHVLSIINIPPDKFNTHNLSWFLPLKITSTFIFLLLIPTYSIFYMLTQFISPSQKILQHLSEHKSLTYAEILSYVRKEDFISTRMNDLCQSNCITLINGRYVLTSSGQRIATTLNILKHVFRREVGG